MSIDGMGASFSVNVDNGLSNQSSVEEVKKALTLEVNGGGELNDDVYKFLMYLILKGAGQCGSIDWSFCGLKSNIALNEIPPLASAGGGNFMI